MKNKTENLKLYSQQAITITTFFGGPLAAGYLIRENYLALDKPEQARMSLIIGITASIILFGSIAIMPESIINKIPNQIIPIIYTAIIAAIVQAKQGKILAEHKENNNEFFSGWKAAGIGLVCLAITSTMFFTYIYLQPQVNAQYDQEIALFTKNETESLDFYNRLETGSKSQLLGELRNSVIPKWEENIKIINRINNLENLPSEIIDQNKLLLKYSELRLKNFRIIQKAISEDTDKYTPEISQITQQIESTLDELNQ